MLIVEGPDGSGKTTLITSLREKLGLKVAPRVVGQDTKPLLDLKHWVETQGLSTAPLIYDRHRLISEFVYGPILRKTQNEGFTDPNWVYTYIQSLAFRRPMIVFCMPPLEVIRKNLEGDPDNTKVVDYIEQIYAGYLAQYSLWAAIDNVYNRRSEHCIPRVIFHDYTYDPSLEKFDSWAPLIRNNQRFYEQEITTND